MAKLGLRSRAQAVAYAYEHGLVTPRRTAQEPTARAARFWSGSLIL
jgi:hypothetical protein